MAIQLKGGFETTDPRLDRIPEFDPRSRQFPARALERFTTKPKSKSWPLAIRLDQGQDGACTGFSRAHDLAAQPVVNHGIDNAFAYDLYRLAQQNDEWPGEDYEGSSVLGAVKAAQIDGYVGEYRWAFGIDDVLGSLGSLGPVVFGTNWLDGMFEPDSQGVLTASGSVAGGHAYLVRGVIYPRNGSAVVSFKGGTIRKQIKTSEPLLRVSNSWSRSWSIDGEALLRASDAERLLQAGGEACVTTQAFVLHT